jgi:hypothetical protein
MRKGFIGVLAAGTGFGGGRVPTRHHRRCRELVEAQFADLDLARVQAVTSTAEGGPIDQVNDLWRPVELFRHIGV